MIYRFFGLLILLCTWPCFSFHANELDLPEGYELDLDPFSEEESNLSYICEKDLKDDPVPTLSYLETLPSSVVAGCVNVITGDFFESQVDLVVPGPKSLVVQKSWNSRDKKWHFSHLPKLFTSLSQSRENREACYLDDTGSGMLFRGPKNLGDSQTLRRGLKVPRKVFQKSMHNCGFGEISGQTNWKNAAIYYVKNTKRKKLLLRHGTHTDRIFSFKRLKNKEKSKQYRLKEERHPGSVSFYYSYGGVGRLSEIKGINAANEVVQLLDISKAKGANTYTWDSKAGNVSYHYDKKDKLLETRSSQNISPSYTYDDQDRIVKKHFADQDILSISYDKGKVKHLSSPVFLDGQFFITHRFKYSKGRTIVSNAFGDPTKYDYKHGRINKITRLRGNTVFSEESFDWNRMGHLLSHTFFDKGKRVFQKRLKYDRFGNIEKETLLGNLTGKRNNDTFVQTCISDSEGWNRPVKQQSGDLWTLFSYVPKTNLLQSRLTGSQETILKREFFEYDGSGVVISEILDDGNTGDKNNLSGVTERHIKKITPTKTFPFGLPEKVEEWCLDLATNTPILLKTTTYTYSLLGKKLQEKRFGSDGVLAATLEWDYDLHGNLIYEKDPLGQVVTYAYDKKGNKIAEQSPGLLKQYLYDKANRLIKEEELWPDGTHLITSHRYNVLSQKIVTTDPYGNETFYSYDALGHLCCIEFSSLGIFRKEHFINDALGNKLISTNALGHSITTKYTARSQAYHIRAPNGGVEKREYNLDGTLKIETAKNGLQTIYTRDCFGRITKTEIFDSFGNLLKTTSARYNTFHLLSETDEEGIETQYAYDLAGRKVRREKNGLVTTFEYDVLGRKIKTAEWIDPNHARITIQHYDLLDRVLEERVEELDGTLFKRKLFGYDFFGNCTKTVTFDENGPCVSFVEYNPQGKPTREIDALGKETLTHYDFSHFHKGHNVLKVTRIDPLGNQDVSLLDSDGHVIETSHLDALGTLKYQEVHEYDLCKQRILTRTLKSLTTWEYDASGNEIRCREAKGTSDEKITRHEYNTFRQKIRTFKPDGSVLHFEYDLFGCQKTLKSSDGMLHYNYTYDIKNRPISVENVITKAKTVRSYANHGRLTSETLENGLNIQYAYDPLDRLIELTVPDGSSIRYNYSACRLLSIDRIKNAQVSYTHSYLTYNLSGVPILEKLIGSAGYMQKSFDPLHRLASCKTTGWEEHLVYDSVGNLTKRQLTTLEGSTTDNYSYDALYQLIQETGNVDHAYDYDFAHNRIEKDGSLLSVNPLNQLLAENENSYIYDKNGNLVKKIQRGQETNYVYDPLNRLVEVKTPKTHVLYSYDAFHRRLSNVCNGHQELYFYQNDAEIGSSVNGEILELRVLGKGLGAEIGASVALELQNALYVPIHDSSGNICLLLDTSGNSIECTRYTAFGEMSFNGISPWKYSSKRFDPETGFSYFGRRYYAPDLGRWITPDPAGFEDGLNLYAYVHNSPLTHIDPDGQFAFLIPIAISFAISCAADYALPIAVATLHEYAGATAATALLAGAAGGYTGNYNSSGFFSGDFTLGCCEKAGMALGTIASLAPSKITSKAVGRILQSEVAGAVINQATKKIASSYAKFSARKALQEVGAGTVEKVTKAAAGKMVTNPALLKEEALCLDKLSKAGQAMDRGNLTKAGRALEKHGNRPGSVFPLATGNERCKNIQGQFHLDDILTHPQSIISRSNRPRYGGEVVDIQIPGHRGARYSKDGEFIGFLNP